MNDLAPISVIQDGQNSTPFLAWQMHPEQEPRLSQFEAA